MPSSSILAAAAAAAALVAAPAFAQDPDSGTNWTNSWYGTLGYANHGVGGADFGTVQGRVGTRFLPWLGVEGEINGGVDHAAIGPHQSASINDQETIYGVGYLPLGHNIDLFARIGYGRTRWNYKGGVGLDPNDHNWNWGAGGQWFWDHKDGIRAEYTRENFDHAPDGDDWAVSYVRRF